ncbi:hypothetical protein K4B79_37325 [Streptomyces lincolnensis]|uniref:tetratricopeptide repeat protein n=1 Tax=Streptomyces lincolnensis TaxID=1915 RepID=UPI001E65AFAA|nr:hypothetical protein [Streptomyces lincolnensis]MCD7443856.1 hypothetical protein [Streptomyces lincolnensis]
MQVRGRQSVSAGGDIGVAVTGDNNQVLLAPTVRSAYWEQVRRIAPVELVDRDAELKDLAAFCTASRGPAYAWWRAGAWAGKTALLSWFALHPPAGVRIVPFFVTARLGAQNDVVAYVDVVLEQLAEISGEGIPAHLTPATREAHLLRLCAEAARVCGARGERLVLLVDGLDEDRGVTTGPDAHSIASLLPGRPEHGLRVLVAGRLNPPLPGDVPGDHPLRDPAAVRTLDPSPYAQAVRVEAERELKRLIGAGGLEYDLLALVTAAGGGLTAPDLAELTGAVPYRVRDVLDTCAGRTFGRRVSVYLLGHEELQLQAEDMLGTAELGRFRGRLHAWADAWRERGWPRETPEYLLRGYARMLGAAGDVDRMTACALDAVRHDRMRESTGGDGAAMNEIRAAEQAVAEVPGRPLLDSVRLAVHREHLGDRNEGLPHALPKAWAAAGRTSRALALARGFSDAERRGLALADVAGELAAAGAPEAVPELWAEAEECARQCGGWFSGNLILQRLSEQRIRAGRYEEAAGTARALDDSIFRSPAYTRVVTACVEAGHPDRARELVRTAPDEDCAARGTAVVVAALAEAGRTAEAELLARDAEFPAARLTGLIALAAALARTGELPDAERLFARSSELADDDRLRVVQVTGLLEAGESERALRLATAIPGRLKREQAVRDVVTHLAEAGDFDTALTLARSLEGTTRTSGLRSIALSLAEAGEYDRALAVAGELPSSEKESGELFSSLTGVLAEAGAFDRALKLAKRPKEAVWRRHARCQIVSSLAEKGLFDRATDLADTIEDAEGRARALVDVATALARSGQPERAERILQDVETHMRCPEAGTAARKLSQAALALGEAGRSEEALALLRGVEELFPGRGVVHFAHEELTATISALAGVGELDRARALLRRIAVDQRRAAVTALVRRLAVSGHHTRAKALAESYVRKRADDLLMAYEVRGALVDGLARAGDFDRAEKVLRETTDGHARSTYRAALALAMARAGLHTVARAHVTLLARTAPFVDTDTVARTLIEIGEHDRALALAAEAESHDEGRAEDHEERHWTSVIRIAETLVAVGRHEDAVDRVERLLPDVDEHSARGVVRLVRSLAEAGALDPAERLIRLLVAPAHAARAHAAVAGATADPVRARRSIAHALRTGGWAPALPALLRHAPETVPLVIEAANEIRSACRRHIGPPTEARTSAPSST